MEAGDQRLENSVKQKIEQAKEQPKADLKLILLGDSAVGKSK